MICSVAGIAQSINIKYEYCIDIFCLLDTSYIIKTNDVKFQHNTNKDIEVVGIFYEEDISGSDGTRVEWNKTLLFSKEISTVSMFYYTM